MLSSPQSSISVLVLSVIISATTAATVPHNSTFRKDLKASQNSDTVHNTEKKVITYKTVLNDKPIHDHEDITIDLKCECVQFYLCDPHNAVVLSTTQDDNKQDYCQSSEVCCKIPNARWPSSKTTPKMENTTMYPSQSAQLFNTEKTITADKVITYKTSVDDKIIQEQCECVVFYLCDPLDVVLAPSSDHEKNQCQDTSNVCCKITNSTQPSTNSPAPPKKSPKPNDCTCVPFWECDNVVNASSLNLCKDSAEVCCIKSTTEVSSNCACTPFYNCNAAYIETLSESSNHCAEIEVCCPEDQLYNAADSSTALTGSSTNSNSTPTQPEDGGTGFSWFYK